MLQVREIEGVSKKKRSVLAWAVWGLNAGVTASTGWDKEFAKWFSSKNDGKAVRVRIEEV